jgi:hypothetical protein
MAAKPSNLRALIFPTVLTALLFGLGSVLVIMWNVKANTKDVDSKIENVREVSEVKHQALEKCVDEVKADIKELDRKVDELPGKIVRMLKDR